MNKVYEIEENKFRQLIQESTSFADFLRKTNIGRGPNAMNNIKKRCMELNLSLEHFTKGKISEIDKLTDEEFIKLINQSSSYKSFLDSLGLRAGRDPYQKVKERCKKLNIDLERKYIKISSSKTELKDILVENSPCKDSYKLKNRLLKEGLLEYKCSICGNPGVWLDKPLSLHLDHINGNHLDNRLENLRILCPNCHTQTETYGSKRGTKSE